MSLLNHIRSLFILIIKGIFGLFIMSVITIILFFLFYPQVQIKDYNFDESINIVNKHIKIDSKEVENIIFSQSEHYTFLGDGGYNIALKLTENGKNRIIQQNSTFIGTFELKNILNDQQCDFTNHHTKQKILLISDFKKDLFYYVSKIEQYYGGEIIYIDNTLNILYYCSYRS